MAALSAFYPFIKPYCIGAPQPLIDQALRDVADDFCRRSRAVREQLDPIPHSAGEALFELDPPSGSVAVAEVMEVIHIDGTRTSVLEAGRPERRDPDAVGEATDFWQPSTSTLRIHPTPKAAGSLSVSVALKPAQNASVLPDVLLSDWRTVLAAGVLARVYAVPGQPYSAPGSVAAYQTIFEEGVVEAFAKTAQGNTRGRLRTQASN